ncbi:MAG: hypothetical protein B6I19_02865 [Bacteroidetes bacterium 4572_114]|nr:MAG: hypothetical protein B6I19_02865 [Bacteroidetes bacterium 4572_114]
MKSIIYNHLLILISFSFLFIVIHASNAQSNMPIQWQGCYGGSDWDYASDMVEHENGYLVIGEVRSTDGDVTNNHGSRDIWLINIDSIGNIVWERCYGGSGPELSPRIISDNNGYYYLIAAVGSNDGDVQSGNHGGYDAWVVKIDGTGEIIWEKCYGSSGTEEAPNIKLQDDGNLLISCKTTYADGDVPAHYGAYDSWIFVITPDGEIIKNAVFGNDLHNSVMDAIQTSDGGYFFTCSASSTQGMVEGTYHGGLVDVWALMLDSNLNIQWQKLYGGSETDVGHYGICELEDGIIFLAQTNSNDGDVSGCHPPIGQHTDIWAVKIDFTGNIIWQRCLGGEGWDFAGSLHQTDDGGFMIFAETTSYGGDVSGNNSWSLLNDIWMVKLSANGDLMWQVCFGGYGNERVYSGTIKKSDHNWVIAGRASDEVSFDVACDLHGYPEDFWVFEIKDTTVNIDEADGPAIKVYPNPAGNWVVFDYELPGAEKKGGISIMDVTGNLIEKVIIFGNRGQRALDIRNCPAGVYFYTLSTGSLRRTGKLIVK